jgi:glycosyltransferase involved in cell wall biosynthesis
MALGRPVVAGAIGQVSEIVRHDEAGYLYEPGDVSQLCESLDRLAAQPELRSRLGKTGHEWVIGHRTWDVNARAILEAAERLSSERSTGGHQG